MSSATSSPQPPSLVHRSTGDRLDAMTLYALLRLRVDVFVVEQACAYPELDGRDLDPTTVHLWLTDPTSAPGAVVGCVRLLDEGGRWRVGRVCTARWARGRGVAAELMRAALVELGDTPSVLNAQSHLADFYAAFGYRPDGDEFVEDGIPHLPMLRSLLRTGGDPPA